MLAWQNHGSWLERVNSSSEHKPTNKRKITMIYLLVELWKTDVVENDKPEGACKL